MTSFCRKGQGPGELEWGGTLIINTQEEILAKDPSKRNILIFNTDSNLIKEISLELEFGLEKPLENGNYLIFWQILDPTADYFQNYLGLCNSEFEKTKELVRFEIPNPNRATRIRGVKHAYIWGASKEYIYWGNEDKGYEINVYDLEGNLARKI